MIRRISLLAVFSLFAASARAQIPYDACHDRAGKLVPGIIREDPDGFAAEATSKDGHPIIYWSDHRLAGSSHWFKMLTYIHECAHIRLRHIYTIGETPVAERQADCWAISLMQDGGLIGQEQEDSLMAEVATIKGDPNHLPGDAEVRNMQLCLAARTDQRAWSAMLDSLVTASATGFRSILGPRIFEITDRVVFQATLGPPSVWDCDLSDRAVYRCPLLAAREQKQAERRYKELTKIARKWLPEGWQATEQGSGETPAGVARLLILHDPARGTEFRYVLTDRAEIWFLAAPGSP
ncbi:MAG: hypothetical protein ACHQXA_05105 [Gemmatimonadales bacterium]